MSCSASPARLILLTLVAMACALSFASAAVARPVAIIGDIDGDGYLDMALGFPRDSPDGRTGAGSVLIVYGGPLADGASPRRTRIDGAVAGDHLGASVAGAGDVDGDGRADLVIGAPGTSHGQLLSGSVYVLYGGTSALPQTYDLAGLDGAHGRRMDGGASGDRLGTILVAGWDVDRDGFSDVVAGTDAGPGDRRTAVIFGGRRGAGGDLAVTPAVLVPDPARSDRHAVTVSFARARQAAQRLQGRWRRDSPTALRSAPAPVWCMRSAPGLVVCAVQFDLRVLPTGQVAQCRALAVVSSSGSRVVTQRIGTNCDRF